MTKLLRAFRFALAAAYFALGFAWLYSVIKVVLGRISIRQTALGSLAMYIDKLPPLLAKPLFVLCWIIFFSGWMVPFALGLKQSTKQDYSRGSQC